MDTVALPNGVLEDLQWLQRFAVRLARDGDEAQDLVQDTLVEAWRSPPRDGDAPWRPWLATVLRNRLRMRRWGEQRREAREQVAPALGVEPRAPDAEHERLKVLETLLEQLQRLPAEDQRIIVRRYFEGESAAEIGRALGIPSATIRSRVHRSLQRLRGSLDRRYGSRETWCAVVLALPPRGMAPIASNAGSSTMSITIKALLITTTMGTAGVAGWLALGPEDPSSKAPATAEASPPVAAAEELPAAPATEATPTTAAPRAQWEQRRASIHRDLVPAQDGAAAPDPAAEAAEEERSLAAHRAFRELVRACVDDLDRDAAGSVTLACHEIGAPGVGTIYESVEVVDATSDDPEVVECVTQSMYAYAGEAPPEAYERHTVWTVPLGDPPAGSAEDHQLLGFVIGAHMGEVRFCESRAEGPVTGSVTLTMTMGDAGTLDEVTTQDRTLPEPVVDCIVAATRRWQFPATLSGLRFEREFVLPVPGQPSGPAVQPE